MTSPATSTPHHSAHPAQPDRPAQSAQPAQPDRPAHRLASTTSNVPGTAPGGATLDVTALLDREWSVLRTQRRALRHVGLWAPLVDPDVAHHLTAVADLDHIVAATHAVAGEAGNQLLGELVRLAAHDQLAGRIVVQRLLPGVLAATVRYGVLCPHRDPVGEAIGALWIALSTYDGARRRGPIAASIISDTMFAAFRRRPRLRSSSEQPIEPHTFDDEPRTDQPCAFIELAHVVRTARQAGVAATDLDLLRHLVQAESPSVVARERKVTPRTIRNRRDKAIAHVRAALEQPSVAA